MAEILLSRVDKDLFNTETVYLNDCTVNPCIDCRACLKRSMSCPVRDDMQEIYKKLEAANILIIGTPIYWFGPSAQTKLFIDRLRPYYRNRKLEGRRMMLLTPAADGEGDCDLTAEMMKRTAALLGVTVSGVVTAKAYDAGDALRDEKLKKILAEKAEILLNR